MESTVNGSRREGRELELTEVKVMRRERKYKSDLIPLDTARNECERERERERER